MRVKAGYVNADTYPEFKNWKSMLARCRYKGHASFKNYGAKGVSISPVLKTFWDFLCVMGPKPTPEHTLDRIDNARGYEPGNMRWATVAEQNRNRTITRHVAGDHRCLAEVARDAGISEDLLRLRLKYGWPLEIALTAPKRRGYTPFERNRKKRAA